MILTGISLPCHINFLIIFEGRVKQALAIWNGTLTICLPAILPVRHPSSGMHDFTSGLFSSSLAWLYGLRALPIFLNHHVRF